MCIEWLVCVHDASWASTCLHHYASSLGQYSRFLPHFHNIASFGFEIIHWSFVSKRMSLPDEFFIFSFVIISAANLTPNWDSRMKWNVLRKVSTGNHQVAFDSMKALYENTKELNCSGFPDGLSFSAKLSGVRENWLTCKSRHFPLRLHTFAYIRILFSLVAGLSRRSFVGGGYGTVLRLSFSADYRQLTIAMPGRRRR
jgi:hypothetical protein